MTTRTHVLGAALAASALILLQPLSASAATDVSADVSARARTFGTLQKMDGAKHQACKTPIPGTQRIRVYNRLVNDSRADAGARMKVLLDGKGVGETWGSGYIPRGRTSPVGSVVVRKGPGYTLDIALFARQYGGGESIRLADVRTC